MMIASLRNKKLSSFLILIFCAILPLQAAGDHFNTLAKALGWSQEKQLLIGRFADDILQPFDKTERINFDEAVSMRVVGTENTLWHAINQREDGTLRTHSPLGELYLAEILTATLDTETAKFIKDLFNKLISSEEEYKKFGKSLDDLKSLSFMASPRMIKFKFPNMHNDIIEKEISDEIFIKMKEEGKKLFEDKELEKHIQEINKNPGVKSIFNYEAYLYKKFYKEGKQVIENFQKENNTFYNIKYDTEKDPVISNYFKIGGQYSCSWLNGGKELLTPKSWNWRNVETYSSFNNLGRWRWMLASFVGTQALIWAHTAKTAVSKHITEKHTLRGAFTAAWNKVLEEGVNQFNPFFWNRTIREGYKRSGWRGGLLQGAAGMMVPLSIVMAIYGATWSYKMGAYGKAETVMRHRLGVFKDVYKAYNHAQELTINSSDDAIKRNITRIEDAFNSSFLTREGKAAGLYAEFMEEGSKTSEVIRKVAIADAVYALAGFYRDHQGDKKEPVCQVKQSESLELKNAWSGIGIDREKLVLNDIKFNKDENKSFGIMSAPPSSGKTVLENTLYHNTILNELVGIALAESAEMPKIEAIHSFLMVDENTGTSSGAGHTQGIEKLIEYVNGLDTRKQHILVLDEPMVRVSEDIAFGELTDLFQAIEEKNKQSNGTCIYGLCISHFDSVKNTTRELENNNEKKYASFMACHMNINYDLDTSDVRKYFTRKHTATFGETLRWNFANPENAMKDDKDQETYNLVKKIKPRFQQWYKEVGSKSQQKSKKIMFKEGRRVSSLRGAYDLTKQQDVQQFVSDLEAQ